VTEKKPDRRWFRRVKDCQEIKIMNRKKWGAAMAVLCGLACLTAAGEDFLHARVSYDAGDGMIKGRDDADWSYATINTIVLPNDTLWVDKNGTLELEMSGGSFLRMADASKVDIEMLPPSGRLRGWHGSFYVQRTARSTGSIEFDTPVSMVDVNQDSMVRIDIVAEGGTTVSVRWGSATVRCQAGGDVVLNAGQRSYVDPGYLPSEPTAFNPNVEDDFDTWNRERARLLAEGEERIPKKAPIDRTPIGVRDLSPYGEWVEVESVYYWRPTVVVDYVPYRYGRWSYVSGAGYCWVESYPFSYVTTHYGRWRYTTRYGWVWTYRGTWGPAWVSAVHYGPHFVWTPLDPFDRPCTVVGGTFAVGRAHFGLYASSYCLADDLLMGSCYVRPVTPVIVRSVPVTQVTVWNINIGSSHGHHHDFARDARLEVRDYAPRRVIRGYDALPSRDPAHARIATLESSLGRQEFAAHRGGPPRERAASVRPEGAAPLRNVSVAPEIRESGHDPRRSAAIMRAPLTTEGASRLPLHRTEETARPDRGDRPGGIRDARGGGEATRPEPGGIRDAGKAPERGDIIPSSRPEGQRSRDTDSAVRVPQKSPADSPERGASRGNRLGEQAGPVQTVPDRTPTRRDDAPRPERETVRGNRLGEQTGPVQTVPDRTPIRRETTPNPERNIVRGGSSSIQVNPVPAPERNMLRSRSRESVPAPVPMRGPEPAPTRTSPRPSEAMPQAPTMPSPALPRTQMERTRPSAVSMPVPRTQDSPARRPALAEPVMRPESRPTETARQAMPPPSLANPLPRLQDSGGGSGSRGRSVEVQRLGPPQPSAPEPVQHIAPRQETGRVGMGGGGRGAGFGGPEGSRRR